MQDAVWRGIDMVVVDFVRVGKISSIHPSTCTAQVTFEDRDNIVTGDFPLLMPTTLQDAYFHMPAIDERVVVLLNPIAPSTGFILGSYYCDTRQPPASSAGQSCVRFGDGTMIQYDQNTHQLSIDIPQGGETSLDIKSKGNVAISSASSISIEASDNLALKGTGEIKLDTDGINANCTKEIMLKSKKDALLEASNIVIRSSGNIVIESAQTLEVNCAKDLKIYSGQDITIEAEGKIEKIEHGKVFPEA